MRSPVVPVPRPRLRLRGSRCPGLALHEPAGVVAGSPAALWRSSGPSAGLDSRALDRLRILFIGHLEPFLTTRARHDAFARLGCALETIDLTPYLRRGRRLLDSLTHWTLLTPPVFALNRAIRDAARRAPVDLVWIEKGVHVFPRTLRALRRQGLTLVYHNTDDWKAQTPLQGLHWRFLLRALPLYDVHITSNLHNVREFQAEGFPRVLHMELAANEAIRCDEPPDPAQRARLGAAAGFIGHWEPDTERSILALVDAGVPVKVYGGGWKRASALGRLKDVVQNRLVWGEEYARAILAFDVNLGIVSKWNRNHTASRTFQIPALGGFLLHERNEVVTRYFREGVEAEFFSSDRELVEKCRHYLAHPEERRRVAEAGRRRCRESGYFEEDRVREILPHLEEAVRARRGD